MPGTIESIWKQYLSEIYQNGHTHTKDDGDEICEIIGVHKTIIEPHKIYMLEINSQQFLYYTKRGHFDIEGYPLKGAALYEYIHSLEDKDAITLAGENSFVYTYPQRIFNMEGMNQFDVVAKRLQNNSGSNRAVMCLYNVKLDNQEQHIPCLNFLQVLVRDGYLTLHCMFRSNDIFNAFPSNMLFLTYLGLKLSEELNVMFKGIDYHCTSAHYYKDSEELVKKVLE